MSKPLINTKKWTRNDFRLLVVLLLTVVYPVFVTSFFALYIFILLPILLHEGTSISLAHFEGWYHYYWLFVAFLWMLLCALILPCFWDKREKPSEEYGLDIQDSPPYPTKPDTVQPFVHIEEGRERQDNSSLSDKSQNSVESIEKICNEKAERESHEKSRESLQKSSPSLSERRKITQSGEFLNDFIDSVGSDELKKEEAECEVHAEENKNTHDQNNDDIGAQSQKDNDDDDDKSSTSEDSTTHNENSTSSDKEEEKSLLQEKDKEAQETLDEENNDKSPKDLPEAAVVEPVCIKQKDKEQETIPLQVTEANIMETKPSEIEDEIEELQEDVAPLREKARPTIDTSRASGYYECSMPTPKSADKVRPESNCVFLFVNPEIASTEESIQVIHEGEVQNEEK